MAHVLLPCDVPSWTDVQRQMSQLKFAHSPEQLVAGMQRINDTCCVGLDPEDTSREEISLCGLKKFLKVCLTAEEKQKFFEVTLPLLISSALKLKQHKPPGGFLYSLQQQAGLLAVDRQFIASLLANSFFSTFPKRNFRTHPTLQDFNFADMFQHLENPVNSDKLKKLLNYFECVFQAEPEGKIYFSRQVTPPDSLMSMPEWMCSDCPLCPLMVRTRGIMEDAEPVLLRTYPCSARIGGDVLKDGWNLECSVFTNAPELLVALAFVESLEDNEALIVDGILAMDHRQRAEGEPTLSSYEWTIILLDFLDHTYKPALQFEDTSLLRELNKCLIAFRQPIYKRRLTPVGRSSSSSAGPDAGFQSLQSSVTSSSRNSIYATDSADPQSDDAAPERVSEGNSEHEAHLSKVEKDKTDRLAHLVKERPEDAEVPKPTKAQPGLMSVLGALKKTTQVLANKGTAEETVSAAPSVPAPHSCDPPVLLSESGSPSAKARNRSKQEDSTPIASRPPVSKDDSQESIRSMSSKGSFEERRRSYDKIIAALPCPSVSSPPLLTHAVLSAQRHPSPRPERRGSGTGQGGMVFRPVSVSPTISRKSAFRPVIESLPILDPRKESHQMSYRPAIPLPDCSFSSLPESKVDLRVHPLNHSQVKHTLSSSPVSSPRTRLSTESPLDDELSRHLDPGSPPHKSPPSMFPEVSDILRSRPPLPPASERGHERSLSGSFSTPYGSPHGQQCPKAPALKSAEDDFFTAEESLSEGAEDRNSPVRTKQRFLRTRRQRSFRTQTSGSSIPSSKQLSRDDSASSAGFVLDYRSDDDDCVLSAMSKHERYEDFRRRIKRRNRRLARRASRGSRMSYSSGSSDMDDIYEDPELGFSPRAQRPIRAANSEPTLYSRVQEGHRQGDLPPLSLASEVIITSSPGRRQMLLMTTRQGLPKAYSFDGVNPNLPVPFKAKFRCRKTPAEPESDSETMGLTRHDADFIRTFALPPASPESSGTSSCKDDSDDGKAQPSCSILKATESDITKEEDITQCSDSSRFLTPSAAGVRPIATCRWSRDGSGSTDVQLEAIIQWLAASMSRVPCFVVYTGGEPKLEQLAQVGFKAEERHWTVGDLACETLRFCRNRLAVHRGRYKGKGSPDAALFAQLIGHTGKFQSHDSLD